jgi:hypothetical protein
VLNTRPAAVRQQPATQPRQQRYQPQQEWQRHWPPAFAHWQHRRRQLRQSLLNAGPHGRGRWQLIVVKHVAERLVQAVFFRFF